MHHYIYISRMLGYVCSKSRIGSGYFSSVIPFQPRSWGQTHSLSSGPGLKVFSSQDHLCQGTSHGVLSFSLLLSISLCLHLYSIPKACYLLDIFPGVFQVRKCVCFSAIQCPSTSLSSRGQQPTKFTQLNELFFIYIFSLHLPFSPTTLLQIINRVFWFSLKDLEIMKCMCMYFHSLM